MPFIHDEDTMVQIPAAAIGSTLRTDSSLQRLQPLNYSRDWKSWA
jgi:hypothetical protein